jgi:polyferredoxin
VIGLILVLITVFIAGRIFCGYVCPLGALQELISMIVKKQYMVDPKISGLIRAAVFVVFILSGLIVPWYMKLDPFAVFTLKPNIFQAILFTLVLAASIFIYRPWCTLICPFGALSSLITRFSLFKICIDEKCNDCGLCRKKCPTCQPGKDSPMGECYFCARCIGVCKKGSLKSKLRV